MKILFITLPGPDHQTDQLYTGLYANLGPENIVTFPPKPTYYDPSAKIWFVPQTANTSAPEEEIIERLHRHEFSLICFAPRPAAIQTLQNLLRTHPPLPPLILLDGEEDSRIRHELLEHFPIRLYFKRDYVWGTRNRLWDFIDAAHSFHWDRNLFQRTFPLPLAVALQTIPPHPDRERTLDVTYVGRASHPCRPKVIRLLKQTSTFRFHGGLYKEPTDQLYKMKSTWLERLKDKYVPSSATPPDYEVPKLSPDPTPQGDIPYFDQLFRSKIAVCLRGGGSTPPIRYFEIVACKTLLLSDLPSAVVPHNFVHKTHAVFFQRNLKDLLSLAEYYIQNDAERQEIIEKGYQHLLQYHTCEKRAKYFLDICRKAL